MRNNFVERKNTEKTTTTTTIHTYKNKKRSHSEPESERERWRHRKRTTIRNMSDQVLPLSLRLVQNATTLPNTAGTTHLFATSVLLMLQRCVILRNICFEFDNGKHSLLEAKAENSIPCTSRMLMSFPKRVSAMISQGGL